jgi:hypothetical protein
MSKDVEEIIAKILENAWKTWKNLPEDKKHEVADSLGYTGGISTFGSLMMQRLRNVLRAYPKRIKYEDFGFTEEEWMARCKTYGKAKRKLEFEAMKTLYSQPKRIWRPFEQALQRARSEEEFIQMVMVGVCPKCKSGNTKDCERELGIEDSTVGHCMDCDTYWCLECGATLENPQEACGHYGSIWAQLEEIMMELGESGRLDPASVRKFLERLDTKDVRTLLDYCQRQASEGILKREYGYVHQDLVNTLGTRLGFEVKYGDYFRGPDGIWNHRDISVIVESKTSPTWLKIKQVNDYVIRGKATFGLVICSDFTEDQKKAVEGGYEKIRLLTTRELHELVRLKDKKDVSTTSLIKKLMP